MNFAPVAALALCLGTPPAFAEWKAAEKTVTYAIVGTTGPELYASIGEKGPRIGGSTGLRSGVIAHTTFDLKWRRDYRPQPDGSCRLQSAIPFMTIITTVPKPSQKLPSATAAAWEPFIDGIVRHEKVHGEHMRAMVDRILATTVGMAVPDDPKCTKIREAVKTPLIAASDEQRRKSRDFDRAEMAAGANIQQLILRLVNGK